MSDTIPAGWYPAPHAGNELRYWDGTAWHAAPAYLPAATPGAPGIPSSPAGPVLPPYASAPGAPNEYPPYPGGALPPSRPVALGVTALSLGIAAIVLGWIPFLGFVVALAGAVFGGIALVRRQPKPLALTGTILSGVGLVLACLMTFSVLSFVWNPPTDDYSYDSGDEYGSAPEDPDSPAVPELEPYAPETGRGSIAEPLSLPYVRETASGTEYTAEVRIVDEDATEEVLSWSSLNGGGTDGYRYVLVEMTVTSTDSVGLPASFPTYDLSLATVDGGVYPYAFVVPDDDTTLLRDAGTIAEGESATGIVAYLVPEDATDLLLTDLAGYYAF